MKETVKTLFFVAAAVVVVTAVWATRPLPPGGGIEAAVGQPLFPDFTDPLAATSMEIVKYDEQTGDTKIFKVAQVDGIWSIPSHDNYPADAADQLAEAATSVMGLKILALISENLGDQEAYGVVDPADKNLKAGTTGVGTRVTMRDKHDKLLLALVIGRRDEEQAANRYVRRVGQDQIYEVKVDTDKLSTRFADWIEPDLLKLNPWDIRQIDVQDYSVDEARMEVIQRGEIWLDYDDVAEKDKWSLAADRKFVDGKWVAEPLPVGMELDTKKLDQMRSALDDLKIVDVARKPAELAESLKQNKEFLRSPASIESLAMRGFYLANVEGEPGIYSNEGEFRCLMKNGVEYVLRFGNISESRRADSDENTPSEMQSNGVNRYIFVMAEFNPTAIPKPKLEEWPGEEPDSRTDEQQTAEPDESEKEKNPADKGPAGDIEARREKIEKENQRKRDEYEEKVAEAKKKVQELNARFADWYYVIPNSVYEKIHLGRADVIVRKKQPTDTKKDDHRDSLPAVQGVPQSLLDLDNRQK